ncbi:hypothetical protein FAGKG844_440013 [Frankia sp. AgKG'84/4]
MVGTVRDPPVMDRAMPRPTRRVDGQGAHPGCAPRTTRCVSMETVRASDDGHHGRRSPPPLGRRWALSCELEAGGELSTALDRCSRVVSEGLRQKTPKPHREVGQSAVHRRPVVGSAVRLIPTGGHRLGLASQTLEGPRRGQRYPIDLHRRRQNRGTAAMPTRGAPGKGTPR